MITANAKTDKTMLRTRAFSDGELKSICHAREILGVDKPSYYHDAIVYFTEKILEVSKGCYSKEIEVSEAIR